MERKTKIQAEEGKQEIFIRREFDLPIALLFKAYTDPKIVAQWMGTNVVKLENKKHGAWEFETSDPKGNVVFRANGVIQEIEENSKITRTFEMENSPFPVQLEFLEFSQLAYTRSKLVIQIVFKSVYYRDEMLKLPFAQGLNMAHNRLKEVVQNLS